MYELEKLFLVIRLMFNVLWNKAVRNVMAAVDAILISTREWDNP